MELTIEDSTLLFNNYLEAEKISVFYDDRAAKVASVWAENAREKALLTTNETERKQFIACANISSSIASALEFPNDYRTFYTCKDEKGNDQGMMVVQAQQNHVYVALLVTNPINIRSSVNDNEPNKVQGAGTCLLNKAEEIAIMEGKDYVRLTPLNSAVAFYKKNGYHFEGWSMVKTVLKIEENMSSFMVA